MWKGGGRGGKWQRGLTCISRWMMGWGSLKEPSGCWCRRSQRTEPRSPTSSTGWYCRLSASTRTTNAVSLVGEKGAECWEGGVSQGPGPSLPTPHPPSPCGLCPTSLDPCCVPSGPVGSPQQTQEARLPAPLSSKPPDPTALPDPTQLPCPPKQNPGILYPRPRCFPI